MRKRETGRDAAETRRDGIVDVLGRKVWLSRLALFVENLWPRLWLTVGVGGLFVLFSLTGIWPLLSRTTHIATLAGFGALLLASLTVAARTPWPSRDAALRRLERRSGMPHRPATAYEDTLSAGATDARTQALWQAHRQRLARTVAGLDVGRPEPRIDRNDPWAARVLMMLLVLTGLGLVGDSARDRLTAAFRLDGAALALAAARLDAWITPPTYTARPPILLADGGQSLGKAAREPDAAIEVPEKSVLVTRLSAGGALAIELLDGEGKLVERLTPEAKPVAATGEKIAPVPAQNSDIAEVKAELKRGVAAARVTVGGHELSRWRLTVIPDNPPVIALTKEVDKTPRGGMKLHYRVTDDHGVASAEARFEQLPPDEGDPRTQWARPDELKGPRLPLDRPPQIALRLPPARAQAAATPEVGKEAAQKDGGV